MSNTMLPCHCGGHAETHKNGFTGKPMIRCTNYPYCTVGMVGGTPDKRKAYWNYAQGNMINELNKQIESMRERIFDLSKLEVDLIQESGHYQSKAEIYKSLLQSISDYVFGNRLACMGASEIKNRFEQHDLSVKFLERGKTEITNTITNKDK